MLLSHDQHPDNLDRLGRRLLGSVGLTLTTTLAAERLGSTAVGLEPWASRQVGAVTVTAVPALHGPAGAEAILGPVTGFVLEAEYAPRIYVSGDNASLELVREIADRFPAIDVAVLFAGAAGALRGRGTGGRAATQHTGRSGGDLTSVRSPSEKCAEFVQAAEITAEIANC